MKKILESLIEKKDICCIFSNFEDTDNFALGYIIGVDEKFYLMEHISPKGELDGLSSDLIDNIYKIETKSSYIDRIQKLFNIKGNKRYLPFDIGDNMNLSLLLFALNNNKLCRIELCDSNYMDAIGLITKIEEKYLYILSINKDGYGDGEIIIDIRCITFISCDDIEEKNLQLLYNTNSKLSSD